MKKSLEYRRGAVRSRLAYVTALSSACGCYFGSRRRGVSSGGAAGSGAAPRFPRDTTHCTVLLRAATHAL
eukprot:6139701-Pleurochrysis_carterae.AAC.1